MAKQKTKETALLIDANALIHRAWHALPPLTSPDGRLVNAAYGFTSVLLKILAAERPTYLAVCWDTPEPTYRHLAYAEYKAQREEQPEEFYAQMPIVKEIVRAFGGTNVERPGYEADDLLATFASRLAKKDVNVTLLTSDHDVWQMIAPNVRVVAFKKGVSETATIDAKNIKELSGLTPGQIADFKALRGDPSDNLKGVPGIGEKTATDLLQSYKNFEGVFKAAHDEKSALTPSLRRRLLDGEDSARKTLPLVRLVTDAPVSETAKDLFRRPPDEDALRRTFTTLGFKTLLARALGSASRKERASEHATERTVPPTAPKPSRGSSKIRHALSPSVKDAIGILNAARAQGALIVRPVEEPRASLFREAPAIALGTSDETALFSESHLADAKIRDAFRRVLEDEAIEKIGHGLKAAWHWAKNRGIALKGIRFDAEIASYILSGGEGAHDLASLAAARLDALLTESEGRPLQEIDAIRALRSFFGEGLAAQNLTRVMDRFETPLIPILAEMEDAGILIDRPYFKTLTGDFRAEKTRLETDMTRLAGEPFNPGSPQQLARVLFDVLKIPSKGLKRGKTGISTAASELEKLEGAHPIVEKIGEYREVAKLLSTYVEALPEQASSGGRVHTTYNQALTSTGRLSSSNPNLQNIPIRTELGRKIRRGFVAPRGFRLLSCDYSQIELRIVAALAKDPKMLEAFNQRQDIHVATAAAIWRVTPDHVTKDERRAAKAINFGIIYGQGPQGLSKSAGIPFDDAKRFIEEYFRVYAGVREYLDGTKAFARANGFVETLFGRRRAIPDINSPLPQFRAAAERMAVNMPVQGTAADLIKLAMIRVASAMPRISTRTRMLLQVHDELVFEVPEAEVRTVARAVADLMENAEKIGVPVVVDAKSGRNWDEMTGV